ncbi:TPA: glycerophosphodiester phosphodiesterase family protein [Elizabethkingia meningoseptica]|uniref:glycerophosphodiester phosphodiesterase family protein n=1 Tax=Elizabethkingia meningoseptica TaxID=238 RepID=UPI0022F1C15E|nr:glycerophosphodiester phosphodiesterase family protein [Elizabethkingia meningoseptica]EJK5329288.1 glycerophosphodiester phosphodiesterase family protein [Elizabethkingia meningoseptica]MDE5432136.1 glycerophosphodiester phosphodiesterase family protein [Elizabethkingia meningoseptica]WBS73481.1 glycerophosphodiester phosphodiesterase family protein [Elizabethkingia meningoseptica]HAY3561287.1 glycerophosphodiester phosphodiesterase family protein [Elizabethkingia meningoseptica]
MLPKISKYTFVLALFFCQFLFSQTNYFGKDFPKDKILVVAHRGDWRNYPENSIKAVNSAIKMGVDIVEIDIQKTKDGQLIIMHDPKLDRTTNGTGKISDVTLAYIKTLILRNGASMPTREKVPTLEEMLSFIKGKRVMLNLDKAWNYLDEVLAIVNKTGTGEQIILKGNKKASELKKETGNKLNNIIYMPMVWPEDYSIYKRDEVINPETYINDFSTLFNPVAYEVIIKDDTPKADQLLNLIKNKKALIWINALWPELCAGHDDDLAEENPDAHWGWMIRKGANIIQTDRPESLIRYLKSIGKKYDGQ